MDNFLFSLNAVGPLFSLMAVGYAARQTNFISDVFFKEANKFVFKFSLPLMLFQNVQTNFHGDLSNHKLIYTALAGIMVTILVACCIIPLFIKRRGQRGSMIQAVYRSNFIIYGVPMATGMYGGEALVPITMLMAIVIPVYNVAAVIILSFFSETGNGKFTLKEITIDILKNPLIIGCLSGILAGYLHIRIPVFIQTSLNDLASIATPLALFVMGGEFQFRRLTNNRWKVLSATLARLVLAPAILAWIFIQMGFRNVELSALLALFATPAAVAGFIMSKNMGCDGELSAQIVVTTTLLSSVSIFCFIYIFRAMGYL
ncbi:MAG: AEC family transporter [Dysgonamonadaceae bacterium]|nr:AEC family transporter [Dysgonamonadaceae bacterium]